MGSNIQDIKPIQQWGAFYLFRIALQIKTHYESWQFEALAIIIKTILLILALIFDIATGFLYITFIIFKELIKILGNTISTILSELLKRSIGILSFIISVTLTIGVLYLIFSHWAIFTETINKIIVWLK